MVRVNKVEAVNYTVVSNRLAQDHTLSWKARGIFLYIYSQSDNWDFYETEVSKHATDGRDSLRTGLDELEKAGYLKRTRTRNDKGQLVSSVWEISSSPMSIKPTLNKPMLENPMLDKATVINNNSIITNNNKYQQNNNVLPSNTSFQKSVVEIVDYLNFKLNKLNGGGYKVTTKKTKDLIKARFNEGFTVDDFKKVINTKVEQWTGTEWATYLQPSTLFGNKFEGYLNQQPINPKKQERYYE
ncbi:conserved phage C-terminal domain-containing protein [Periweissella fabaria]|uniref:Phage conserved hypothetical protein C-terminal domain-containing protein n=1 Tax=Periweissella fabaria TaxID=546157 RepID=A0ABM8Z843_9LACO|nr:conserved phage C-terminal domain-containing protein [Periweissella fabaria]MCM0596253.1 conserved phage C-terminal domain-containing protein [Periweissella fabaria]CAH0417495.1 hypothetical protein WFA24289_01837 [Periweissella fabaria]